MDIFTEPWNFVLFQKSCEWSRIQSVNATTILEVLIGNQLLNMPFVNVHPMSLLWNVLILSPSIIPQCSICNNFPSCVEGPQKLIYTVCSWCLQDMLRLSSWFFEAPFSPDQLLCRNWSEWVMASVDVDGGRGQSCYDLLPLSQCMCFWKVHLYIIVFR